MKKGKVLIARRKPGKKRGGYWEFPGGKIRNGETPEECLKREVLEELDIHVFPQRFLGSFTHSYPDVTVVLQAYLCKWIGGEMSLRDHDEVRWIEPEELLNFELSPADIPVAKIILTGFAKSNEGCEKRELLF